jgi:hypothetical protein
MIASSALRSLWVKTRIAVQRPNVGFRRLRTFRQHRLGPLSADFVAKVCDERNKAPSGRRSMTFILATRSLGSGGFDAYLVLSPR